MKRKELDTSSPSSISENAKRCNKIDKTTEITTDTAETVISIVPTLLTSLPVPLSSSDTVITLSFVSPMENVDVLRLVVSFIGPKHYRFIAVISQSFYTAYAQEFPNDTETELNASTVEYG